MEQKFSSVPSDREIDYPSTEKGNFSKRILSWGITIVFVLIALGTLFVAIKTQKSSSISNDKGYLFIQDLEIESLLSPEQLPLIQLTISENSSPGANDETP